LLGYYTWRPYHLQDSASPGNGLVDQFVMKTGDDDGLSDPVRLERVELAIEQGAPAEVDKALGFVVHHMPKAGTLPCGKNDRLVHGWRHCLSNAAAIGH